MNFFDELKRRNVFRVGIAYVIVAWILAQVADLFLESFNAPEWVIQSVLVLLVIGFPLAIFLAWVYELTPEGMKKEKDVDRSQSITPKTSRKLDYIIIALLGIGMAYFIWESRFSHPEPDLTTSGPATSNESPASGQGSVTPTNTGAASGQSQSRIENSIAVLPFLNMSNDPDNEFFSDGVSEEILNVLARMPELKVAARTSAFAYKGSNKNISDIARELKVAIVLEGSVRKAGNQVRVTAQLIQASDGFHLWSDTYDRQLDNIFAIQDEIATAIATALKLKLNLDTGSAGNLTGTNSIEAYEYFLQGMAKWHLRTPANLYSAIDDFDKAIEIDPDFARAHAGAALVWTVLPGYVPIDASEAEAAITHHTSRALLINPDIAETFASLGNLSAINAGPGESRAHFERSIELNPSFATAYQWLGNLLTSYGDHAAALQNYQKAWDLDPRSRIIGSNYALALIRVGQNEEAIDIINTVIEFAPEFPDVVEMAMLFHMVNSDCSAVAAHGHHLVDMLGKLEDHSKVYVGLCEAQDDSSRSEFVNTILAWPPDSFAEPSSPSLSYEAEFGLAIIELRQFDAMLILLERLIGNGITGSDISWFRSIKTPNGRAFACDPRAQAVFEKANLPAMLEPVICD